MTSAFTISRDNGNIHIGASVLLTRGLEKGAAEASVADWLIECTDHRNGYEWLQLGKLTFGGQPANISLCFHDSQFEQASWSVDLPNADQEGGWPTRVAVDAEIAFVRGMLATEMGIYPGKTAWGEVWSRFDKRDSIATHGLRYRNA